MRRLHRAKERADGFVERARCGASPCSTWSATISFVAAARSVALTAHLVEVVEALRVAVEHAALDRDRLAGEDLAEVVDVHREREHRAALGEDRPAETEAIVEGVGRAIEREHVVGDVHVPVLIGPLGQDLEPRLRPAPDRSSRAAGPGRRVRERADRKQHPNATSSITVRKSSALCAGPASARPSARTRRNAHGSASSGSASHAVPAFHASNKASANGTSSRSA